MSEREFRPDVLEAIQARFLTPESLNGKGSRFREKPESSDDRPDYELIALQLEDKRLRDQFDNSIFPHKSLTEK